MAQFDFGAGSSTLVDGANKVAEARGDFTTMASKLGDQIEAMRAQWSGEGARAFFALAQAWTEKQNKVVTALDHFEESLRGTDKDNVQTDGMSNQAMAKLQGRMG